MRARGLVVGTLLVVGAFTIPAAEGAVEPISPKIAPWLAERLQQEGATPFLVLVEREEIDAAAPERLYRELAASARASQQALADWLEARGVRHRRFYLVNAVLLEGDLSLAQALAARPEVLRLVGNPRVRVHEPEGLLADAPLGTDATEWGVEMVGAPEVWSAHDVRGEGIVVASMDTGAEWDHPALKAKYRGWDEAAGTVDHAYSWHDAVEDLATPIDDHGHGTHTIGTMVGDDGEGNQVGVAPGAQYIACRNMDHGVGTPALYLDCMEWTFAPYPPGGDPFTDGRPELAPDIVNNSWGCPPSEGCDPDTLHEAFVRMRQAGIWQVVAAGNSGPTCGSVKDPPAIYAESFSVGAVNASRTLAFFSSRGPVTINGSNLRKPNVSAPGEGVRSATRGGGYSSASGTSMAAPHVAGVGALLWSARPGLRDLVDISRCLLERSAQTPVRNYFSQTCGGIPQDQYPNALAGWGIVDAAAALALPNADGDLVADPCDCAATDAGAFAAPAEVTGLGADPAAADRITWDSQAGTAGTGTLYDLLRGDVDALRTSGTVDDAACRASGLAEAGFTDEEAPDPGRAFYYLARARNTCGTAGWGASSAGTARASSACDD